MASRIDKNPSGHNGCFCIILFLVSNNPISVNLSGMLFFVRVVETGSFTAAAKVLNVSKASVSREINALEDRLGAQLLRRTTRTMSLTEIGDVFYSRCLRVLEEAEAAELSVSELRAQPRGSLRVAAPMSFGHLEIAPRIVRFIERYPELRIEFELTDRVVDLIHERIDLAIRIRRPQQPSLVMRRVCPIRGLIVASPDFLRREGVPSSFAALSDYNCLLYRDQPATWISLEGERIEVSGNFSVDNGDALRQAALAGIGLATLPTFLVANDVRSGRLEAVLTDQTSPGTALFAVYPESRHLSPKVRAFIDWLAEELGPEPDWDAGLPVEGRRPGRAYFGEASAG